MTRRSCGSALDENDAVPHETAALPGTSEVVKACVAHCAKCGQVSNFGLLLGRAQAFDDKCQSTTWGGNAYQCHPVSSMIFAAEQIVEDRGLSKVTIPLCDRTLYRYALGGEINAKWVGNKPNTYVV